jgi:hypothetical protein
MKHVILSLAACVLLSGCEGGFASPSRVDSLRVLAVKTRVYDPAAAEFSETASGHAGARVRLELFGVDGAAPAGGARPLQTAWFSGCHNPPTRQFYACYPLLNALASAIEPELVSERNANAPRELFSATAPADLSVISEAAGTAFEFTLPENILTAAPRSDRDTVHFGVSFVFFAVCAGVLEARPELRDQVPVACVDPTTRADVGPKNFVSGFVAVYSYDGVVNQNPRLSRLTFGGVDVDAACASDADCELPSDAPEGLSRRCTEAGRCILKVPRCVQGKCPKFLIEPKLAAESAEILPGGDNEVIWANFYASAGALGVHAELLNDRSLGLTKEPGSYFTPPKAALSSVDLWLTVDDQRGGTDYHHFNLEVGE